ncbi:MAG: DDE-type integrase/transposase/recombinase, partial [Clostridiales bacterium]|nr:DDE-type integrase/transposase/recombinase [Clostridiales bacterium]
MNEILENMLIKESGDGHIWRILWVSEANDFAYIFNVNTTEMPSSVSCNELKSKIDDGFFTIQESDPYLLVISENELSDKERLVRDEIWNLMSNALTSEPGIYEKKQRGSMMSAIMSVSGKDLKNLHRYLKTYWQKGKIKNAFIPDFRSRGGKNKERAATELKRGRPSKYGDSGINIDEATKAIFEKAIKKYYHTRDSHTLQYAYDMMIAEHYAQYVTQSDGKKKAVLPPIDELPTIRQFRYWYGKMHGEKEKITKRKGETKFNLNHRAVLGKSDHSVMGPGAKYEIDATIGDIYLLSRFNRADIIGRPVLYFVIDVFSRMVTGMYIGLEGPSWAGMMMAIANAVSDKVKYCAEYGIEITEDEWPCRGVPGAIRGDRGELESKAADTLVNALSVRAENAPPYRADMKGIVEQHFNTINGTTVAFLPGRVRKEDDERGGNDYRLKAILDINQLTKIMIQSVLQHNNYHLLEGYERTENMIKDNVVPIPLEIWNWGIKNYAGALRTFPEESVKLALMPADTASVTP